MTKFEFIIPSWVSNSDPYLYYVWVKIEYPQVLWYIIFSLAISWIFLIFSTPTYHVAAHIPLYPTKIILNHHFAGFPWFASIRIGSKITLWTAKRFVPVRFRCGSCRDRFMDSFGSIRFGSCLELTALLLFIKEVYAVMSIATFKLYPLVFVTFWKQHWLSKLLRRESTEN